MSKESSKACPVLKSERTVLSYAVSGEQKYKVLAWSWCALIAGLFVGMCVVGECCEHTDMFFAKGGSTDINSLVCVVAGSPFAIVLNLALSLCLRKRFSWIASFCIGVAAPIVAMVVMHDGHW